MLTLPPQLDALIGHLSLEPLSLEGGWFKALYRAADASAILYAVRVGEPCRLHRIPQRETYTFLAGNPARFTLLSDPGGARTRRLGLNPGEILTIPGNTWQAIDALSHGPADYSFFQITVVPPFQYGDRQMSDPASLSRQFPEWSKEIVRLSAPL